MKFSLQKIALPWKVFGLFAVGVIFCGNAWAEEIGGNGNVENSVPVKAESPSSGDKNVAVPAESGTGSAGPLTRGAPQKPMEQPSHAEGQWTRAPSAQKANAQNSVPARYYIAQFQAKVVPNRMFTFVMPEAGEIETFVQPLERVSAGTLLAFVNREKFEDERAELELRIEQEKLAANKEILTLVFKKEELEFFSKLSEEERAMFQKDGDEKSRTDQRALDLLDEEIRLAKIKAKKSEERARKDFETRRQSVEMRAPFAGKVELHFTRGNDENEKIPLYPSVPVVTIADDSDYFIAFPMANVAWARLPKNQLRASISIGAGTQILGDFSHARIEKRGNVETLVYFF